MKSNEKIGNNATHSLTAENFLGAKWKRRPWRDWNPGPGVVIADHADSATDESP